MAFNYNKNEFLYLFENCKNLWRRWILVNLPAFSLEYTTKQWTPSVFIKLSNLLKVLISLRDKLLRFFTYHCTHTVIKVSENGLNLYEYKFSVKTDTLIAVQYGCLQAVSFIYLNLL